MISCLTLVMTFECSLEFLHNNSTVESIRYSDGGCYDKSGKCKPGICSCSEDCTTFHWNFTSKAVQTNDSFGCQMRIYNSTFNSFYKVYTSAVYNGTGTFHLQLTGTFYNLDMKFSFFKFRIQSKRKCSVSQQNQSINLYKYIQLILSN